MESSWSSSSSCRLGGSGGGGPPILQCHIGGGTCFNRRRGGCKFWLCYDPLPSTFLYELLVDLRGAVWSLKKQNTELRRRLDKAEKRVKELEELAVANHSEEFRDEGNEEMRAKICRLQKEAAVWKFLLKCLVVVSLVLALNKWLC